MRSDAESQAELVPRQADAEALAEVYRQGVESATASPGVGEYLRDTIIYSLSRFFDWLSEMSGLFSGLRWDLVRSLLTVAILGLVALLLFLLVRRFLRRQRISPGDGRVSAEPSRRPAPASRDWAEQLRLCLERGDVAGSLEALWWWLATAVGVPDADPAWTSRELLLHAGRGDLRRPVRRLDHLIYGPDAAATGDVDDLWRTLRPRVSAHGSDRSGEAV